MKSNMKLIMVSVILLFYIVSVHAIIITTGETVAARGSDVVSVTLLKYEPIPARPGNYLDVYLKFDTLIGSVAKDAAVWFEEKFPFSIVDPSKKIQSIGFYSGVNDAIVKFRLYIDPAAPPGINTVTFRYTPDQHFPNQWRTAEFDVDVQLSDIILSVDKVQTLPETVKAGEIAELKIVLTNNKNSALRDVSVKLDLNELPFNVISSTNEKVFPLLLSKKTIEANFKILIAGDTDSGVYNLPITITYSDDSGKSYTKKLVAGVIVDNIPDFLINLDESSLYRKDKPYSKLPTDKVLLSVTNTGSSQIKAFSMELLDTEDYVVLGNPLMTPTNLDPDDYETQEFTIHVQKPVKQSKKVPMKVKIRYKSSFNNKFESTETVMLTLLTREDAYKFGLAKKPHTTCIFILVVILVIMGCLVYRKWFKKKNKT